MTVLSDHFHSWIEFLGTIDRLPVLNEAATESEIEQAEQRWGFEFIPEVRELYLIANGTDRDGPGILPYQHMVALNHDPILYSDTKEWEASFIQSEVGRPCHSLPIFRGNEDETLTAVICDVVGQGAVWTNNEEPSWETRSLTEFFALLLDYRDRAVFVADATTVGFAPWTLINRSWQGDRTIRDNNGQWRWEDIDWRPLTELRKFNSSL